MDEQRRRGALRHATVPANKNGKVIEFPKAKAGRFAMAAAA